MNFFKKYLQETIILGLAVITISGVYAAVSTLQPVNPGDTLSSEQWNTIVDKLDDIGTSSVKDYVDASVSANGSRPTFMGYTTNTYNGDMGGIKGMNDKCNTDYSESHACQYEEILALGNAYPWSENAWLSTGTYSTSYNYKCRNWSLTTASTSYRGSSLGNNGEINQTAFYCNSSLKIPCCK